MTDVSPVPADGVKRTPEEWSEIEENVDQQQIAENMYGTQADQLLASSWLANRLAGERARTAEAIAQKIEQGPGGAVISADFFEGANWAARLAREYGEGRQ